MQQSPARSDEWTERPITPGSLLWSYAGDRRISFTGLATGILQLMHPAIGAGVVDHSDFFNDPWDRVLRSIPQILGVIYAPDPAAVGKRVRNYHRRINGTDGQGRDYQALDPATFWWAHATFQWGTEMIIDRFDHRRLSAAERDELYLDGVEWYRRYGMPMEPVPRDRRAFAEEWDRHLEEVLEMTPAAARTIEMVLQGKRGTVPFLPDWTRPLHPLLVTPALRLTALGGLPRRLRRRFDIPWWPHEEAQYRSLQLLVRGAWPLLPASVRISEPARPAFWTD